ncbi:MAG TPA: ferritin [Thermodesulfovibrionia bacterium]|nr:ferritin [Thermodesulfovibrionia bacterium]
MLSDRMQKSLNQQLNAELYSSYLYLSMSTYFLSINFNGFANWMKIQAQEEMVHAMKVFDFINDRNGRITLMSIAGPPCEWSSPLDAFSNALQHEQHMSQMINNFTSLAIEEKDHATNVFLQWFVNEQVEEEATANDVVQTLKLIGDGKDGLFMLDRELATRTFTPPTPSN